MSERRYNSNSSIREIGVTPNERKERYDQGVAILTNVKTEMEKGVQRSAHDSDNASEANRLKWAEVQIQLANANFTAAGIRI